MGKIKNKIKELFSTKYAPRRQFSWVEGVHIGLYVACILVSLELLQAFFISHPEYLLLKFNDGTSLLNQVLINKAFILLFLTLIFGVIYQRQLHKRHKNRK